MGHVERGEKNLSLSTMVRISDALSIRLHELFLWNKNSTPRLRKARVTDVTRLQNSKFSFVEIKHVLTELRIERNALKQAVRDLVQVGKKLGR